MRDMQNDTDKAKAAAVQLVTAADQAGVYGATDETFANMRSNASQKLNSIGKVINAIPVEVTRHDTRPAGQMLARLSADEWQAIIAQVIPHARETKPGSDYARTFEPGDLPDPTDPHAGGALNGVKSAAAEIVNHFDYSPNGFPLRAAVANLHAIQPTPFVWAYFIVRLIAFARDGARPKG